MRQWLGSDEVEGIGSSSMAATAWQNWQRSGKKVQPRLAAMALAALTHMVLQFLTLAFITFTISPSTIQSAACP